LPNSGVEPYGAAGLAAAAGLVSAAGGAAMLASAAGLASDAAEADASGAAGAVSSDLLQPAAPKNSATSARSRTLRIASSLIPRCSHKKSAKIESGARIRHEHGNFKRADARARR
jgi:hypothetical protein